MRRSGAQGLLPEAMANGFGLLRVEQDDVFEVVLEILDELRSEGDFGNKQNDGLASSKGLPSECKINVSFAGASNTVKQNSVGGIGADGGEGALLSGIERDVGWSESGCGGSIGYGCLVADGGNGLTSSNGMTNGAAFLSDAAWQYRLDNGRHRATIIIGEPSKRFE